MKDRRQHRRISISIPVNVILQEKGAPLEVLRPNLSWGGIGFFTPDDVQQGDDVAIRFHFESREGSPIQEEAAGEVVWTRQDGNYHAVGIRFRNEARPPRLKQYLDYADLIGD